MSERATLVRGLGLTAAASANIANMIGTGVFLKTRVMTCNVGEPGLVLAVWVVAGLLAMAGALSYAELAAMMPRAGGAYVFLREAYGRPMGFLYGWTIFGVARTGSQAALAVGCAIFLNILLGGALEGSYFSFSVIGHTIPFGKLQLAALGAIAVVTLINCAAVSVSGNVSTVLTVIKIGLVLTVGAGAALLARGNWAHFSLSGASGACEAVASTARGGWAGFGAAMLGALWAYDGWDNVTSLAGEVRNPQRNMPLAFIGAMLVVGALYLFVNVSYFYVLSPGEIASVPLSSSVASEVARKFLGPAAVGLIAMALLASSFGALHSSVLANSRVPYAMAQDGLFFRKLAAVSPHSHVPVNAILAQSVWASALALSGTYDTLTDCVMFASWLLYGLTTASVFVFRRRLPDAERPYRTWGYPVVPVLFLVVTGWLLANTLRATPFQAIAGLALISLGLPLYWYWSRHAPVGASVEAVPEPPQ
ncbi:MAG: amino acid permease [Acidobacteria bacterium]|nr:amino acid permease [Acidobacteriota bacterium]